ncbi:hypothetical protein T459_35602 [Capsicum annuum]|uniref:pectinesterase n=1 Tax=Capsicum annuum TaxID=4072 RepID=A0A2G2WVX4_CAPAN|nr:hypothetical protein T459_35602 [Capsicum annuum]
MVVLLATSYLAIFSEAGSSSSSQFSNAILIKVDQSGRGDYRRIQDAIDAVPSRNSQHVFILVKPGVYREKVVVPADKPFITISGRKNTVEHTIITGNDYGDIFKSPTFTVFASDFVARYLTIQVCKSWSMVLSVSLFLFLNCFSLSRGSIGNNRSASNR